MGKRKERRKSEYIWRVSTFCYHLACVHVLDLGLGL
jgi:hypothetical protein